MQTLQIPLDKNSNREYKLCILGDSGVGKTSLATRFVESRFADKYTPTIEDIYTKSFELDGNKYEIKIIDTSGTNNVKAMIESQIRNSHGFALIYSVGSSVTFDTLYEIYDRIMNVKKEQPALVLVGNKVDLVNSDKVVREEKGQALADHWNCTFFQTSAKDSIKVDEIFIDLIEQLNRRATRVRRASRQEDVIKPKLKPSKYFFCCPFSFY